MILSTDGYYWDLVLTPSGEIRLLKIMSDKEPRGSFFASLLRTWYPVNQPITGAEIGVKRGQSSETLLDRVPNLHSLAMIDPWAAYKDWDQTRMDEFLAEAQKRTGGIYSHRRYFVKSDAIRAAIDLSPNTFNFALIDADHTKAYAIVCAWWDRVSDVIMGRHYYFKSECRSHGIPEVRDAVDAFCEENKLYLHHQGANWWIFKDGFIGGLAGLE